LTFLRIKRTTLASMLFTLLIAFIVFGKHPTRHCYLGLAAFLLKMVSLRYVQIFIRKLA